MNMEFNLNNLLRPNIRNLKPYSSARHEFSGNASVFLDANENSLGSPLNKLYNRYPDPNQTALKEKIADYKGVAASQIFLGNGSDEAIDLLFRMFCDPGKDQVLICPPTYGMYGVSAAIHGVEVVDIPLNQDFQLDTKAILARSGPKTKLLFICSPNNPSGNSMHESDVRILLQHFQGIVVVDEAYIDFSTQKSWIHELKNYPNLVVMQTFSKAWGLAALRIGMAFASDEIIDVINKVKAPYNLNEAVQELASEALRQKGLMEKRVQVILAERIRLENQLRQLKCVTKVYPSDANFLLIKTTDAKDIYHYLIQKGIVVRDRSNVILCENCLRITIGSPAENDSLIENLRKYAS